MCAAAPFAHTKGEELVLAGFGQFVDYALEDKFAVAVLSYLLFASPSGLLPPIHSAFGVRH
jgi:hypothetical protein